MAGLREVFEGLKDRAAAPPAMKGVTAVYQFVLDGEEGGNYLVRFTDGAGVVDEGRDTAPDVTISMTAADFRDLAAGRLNSTTAFLSGRLKVEGDIGLAMKLQSILG